MGAFLLHKHSTTKEEYFHNNFHEYYRKEYGSIEAYCSGEEQWSESDKEICDAWGKCSDPNSAHYQVALALCIVGAVLKLSGCLFSYGCGAAKVEPEMVEPERVEPEKLGVDG